MISRMNFLLVISSHTLVDNKLRISCVLNNDFWLLNHFDMHCWNFWRCIHTLPAADALQTASVKAESTNKFQSAARAKLNIHVQTSNPFSLPIPCTIHNMSLCKTNPKAQSTPKTPHKHKNHTQNMSLNRFRGPSHNKNISILSLKPSTHTLEARIIIIMTKAHTHIPKTPGLYTHMCTQHFSHPQTEINAARPPLENTARPFAIQPRSVCTQCATRTCLPRLVKRI